MLNEYKSYMQILSITLFVNILGGNAIVRTSKLFLIVYINEKWNKIEL